MTKNNNTSYFGTEPIAMSYIDPHLPIMTQFEIKMDYPYRFCCGLTEESRNKLIENPESWIRQSFTDDEITEYIKRALKLNAFKIKYIQ